MKMNDLISIIVPVYNIEEYIGVCLKSLINQTYKNIEIIVVNDGSTDRSKSICEDYAEKDSRIIIINKPNGGLVSARKAGLSTSNGKYISNVDGDDWVDPMYIQNMYNEIKKNDYDVVISGFNRDLDNVSIKILNNLETGEYTNEDITKIIYNKLINHDDFFEFGIYSYMWNKLFKKDLLFDFQMAVPNEIFIGEDSACVFPVIINSNLIKIIDACDYHYRQRPNSMLKKEANIKTETTAFSLLYKHLVENLYIENNSLATMSFQEQIKRLVVGLMIVRTGGYIIKDDVCLFSIFENLDKKSNIGIYSAGTFGQHVYRKLKYYFGIKNINWYDQDYKQYLKHNLNVESPKNLKLTRHDYIIICSLSKKYIIQVSKELVDIGYEKSRIIEITNTNFDIDKIITIL